MQVIPVIDISKGLVVRAVRGDRASYQPIQSALCEHAEPVEVARRLCERVDARQLYLADLDALQGAPAQIGVWHAIGQALPQVTLWVDGGFATAAALDRCRATLAEAGVRWRPVLGSESLTDLDALAAPSPMAASDNAPILSLDCKGGDGSTPPQRLDVAGCWDHPERWPSTVIVMSLARVGSHQGPDLDTFRAAQALRPEVHWVGAGGIRDADDLAAAATAGASAWLVASALHDLTWPGPPAAGAGTSRKG